MKQVQNEDSLILGTTVQHLVTQATWRLRFLCLY